LVKIGLVYQRTKDIDQGENMPIHIPQDSGNAIAIDDSNLENIRLHIRKDTASDHKQFFNFCLTGQVGEHFKIHIEHADEVSYPGWTDKGITYRATASYDEDTWSRLNTTYDRESGMLTIEGVLEKEQIHIAYFAPYTYERHLALIEKASTIPNCTVQSLGKTQENRDITQVTIGTDSPKKKHIYVIARQHPGETMAEWYAEGLIESLAKEESQFAEFFEHAVLHIIPNINPDGSQAGNLRTNAQGKDLNREWDKPNNQDTAPEVYYVRKEILRTGAAAVLDIHGDETNPYVFPDGRLGCKPNPEMEAIEAEFIAAYQKTAPYLESQSHYDDDGTVNFGLAAKFFAEYLGCLSITFEMPNKERASSEDWTPQDCKSFGAALIPALISLLPKLENKKLEVAGVARGMSFLNKQATIDKEKTNPVSSNGCCIIM
jgi:murein tripeptide amidase MpaA